MEKTNMQVSESLTPYNPFEETIPLMLSDDYKLRFVAEYIQLKIRCDRLRAFNTKIEAARSTNCDGKKIPEPEHDCSYEMLHAQQHAMEGYLHILELRAVIEGIDLHELKGGL